MSNREEVTTTRSITFFFRIYSLNNEELVTASNEMFMHTLGYTIDKFITTALKSMTTTSRVGKHDHSYHTVTPEEDQIIRGSHQIIGTWDLSLYSPVEA